MSDTPYVTESLESQATVGAQREQDFYRNPIKWWNYKPGRDSLGAWHPYLIKAENFFDIRSKLTFRVHKGGLTWSNTTYTLSLLNQEDRVSVWIDTPAVMNDRNGANTLKAATPCALILLHLNLLSPNHPHHDIFHDGHYQTDVCSCPRRTISAGGGTGGTGKWPLSAGQSIDELSSFARRL